MFDEISKVKQDFPKVTSVKKEVKNYKMNFYQFLAISVFIICLFLGIIFGNLFATCQTSSYFFSDSCYVREFNFSVMICIWFVGLLISVMIFSIGHIIALLTEINQKLVKIDNNY